VFEEWRLPPAVVSAIRYHHAPLGLPEEQRELAALLSLADSLVADAGIGLAWDTLAHHPGEPLLEWLGFDWEGRAELQARARDDLQVFRRILEDES
jgi:hypothetical protein